MHKRLEQEINFLLGQALQKCGNMDDARDITQETLLSALLALQKGEAIAEMRGFLLTVLNRKFYDMLRRKYRKPTVTFGEDFEFPDETDLLAEISQSEEAAAIRREVAYLSEMYREIVTRRYFRGESVAKIAKSLGMPEGTVKSRLSFARSEMKKGMEIMEPYAEVSFIPQKLYVRNSGRCGLDDEPMSLVPDDDVFKQNLLLLAYEKPVSVSELARALGTPAAFVEPVVNFFVKNELMVRQENGKVYTDFVIYDPEDYTKYLDEQERFAKETAKIYLPGFQRVIDALKQTDFYSLRLERFLLLHMAQKITWDSLQPHIRPQIFTDRPNGGRWIAFGNRWPAGYSSPDLARVDKYSMSGERSTRVESYLGNKFLTLRKFETSLDPQMPEKYNGFGYTSFSAQEEDLTRLLYILRLGATPESVGFAGRVLQHLPLLEKLGYASFGEGAPKLLVPVLSSAQYDQCGRIIAGAMAEILPAMTEKTGLYIKAKMKKLPPHLKSVPDQKRLMPYEPSPMLFVFQTIQQGLHPLDLGVPYPEAILIIET